jgi:hypothetical protein
MTLSELATRIVAFLESLPRDRRVCEDCTAAYLNADRQDVLSAFREMIGARRGFVGYGRCDVCHADRIVARLRPEP